MGPAVFCGGSWKLLSAYGAFLQQHRTRQIRTFFRKESCGAGLRGSWNLRANCYLIVPIFVSVLIVDFYVYSGAFPGKSFDLRNRVWIQPVTNIGFSYAYQ